jgi:hypothetical protein
MNSSILEEISSMVFNINKKEYFYNDICFNMVLIGIENINFIEKDFVISIISQDCIEESYYESDFDFDIEDINEYISLDLLSNKIKTKIQYSDNKFYYYYIVYDIIYIDISIDNKNYNIGLVFYSSKKNTYMSFHINKIPYFDIIVRVKIFYNNYDNDKNMELEDKIKNSIEIRDFINHTK